MSQTFNGQPGGMIASLLPRQQVIVYGPNGVAYANPEAARAAGVFDFSYSPPMAAAPVAMPVATSANDVTDWASLPFAPPTPRGSFNPMALRGSGLLTEAGSAVLPNNVPMYENTWKVPDYLAPARVQAMQASAGMGGGSGGSFDPFSGGEGYKVSYDPNSYTGGLVASLFGQQAPVDVVRMDPNTGQVTGTDYGTFSPQGLADALSAAGYSDTGGYNDSAPDMSGFDSGGFTDSAAADAAGGYGGYW